MYIKEFPNSEYSFKFYVNYNKKTFRQIKSETGCYALCNLWYYDMNKYAKANTKSAVLASTDCDVILDGSPIKPLMYRDWGICISDNGELSMNVPDNQKNYCVGLPTQYYNKEKYCVNKFVAKNGCTHIGFKENGNPVILLASKDKGLTNDQANQYLLNMGCVNILRYDGSWSSQGDLGDGVICKPSQTRIVQSYLLIYKRTTSNETVPTTPKDDDVITTNTSKSINVQLWAKSDALRNSALTPKGIMVHSTATPNVSAQRFRDLWNRSGVGASVHCFVDDKNIIQCMDFNKRAGHCAGSGNSTHLSFEMCEPSGIKYNSSGSAILTYNPPTDYFKNIWDNATWLCAYWCKIYNLNPLTDICSHAEGYKKGIASNHADTGHWFKFENKTMDDFRQDVYKILNNGVNTDVVDKPVVETPVVSQNKISQFQTWLNSNYNTGLIVDGVYGTGTKKGAIKAVQTYLNTIYKSGLIVDGIWGNKTKSAIRTVSKGQSNNAVYILQGMLYCNGIDCNGLDGAFGNGTYSAVVTYQKNKRLAADGIAGQATFESLMK